ncbi:hypothetical protein ACHAXR_004988 [Thalassiosira sp. AJA248-18]
MSSCDAFFRIQRLFKCMLAVIVLGQAPHQSALAFAPSINAPATPTASARRTRQLISQYSVLLSPKTYPPASTINRHDEPLVLFMSDNESSSSSSTSLPVFLDPGTKGGAVVLSVILFIIPILMYQVATAVFGVDEIVAGRNIGAGFTIATLVLWGITTVFRVATGGMTYPKQLKDYEDAVIAKRLEELDEDEVQALVEVTEREQF